MDPDNNNGTLVIKHINFKLYLTASKMKCTTISKPPSNMRHINARTGYWVDYICHGIFLHGEVPKCDKNWMATFV